MQNKKPIGHKHLRNNYGKRGGKYEDTESYLSSAKKRMGSMSKKSRVNSYLVQNNQDLETTPRNDASSSALKQL